MHRVGREGLSVEIGCRLGTCMICSVQAAVAVSCRDATSDALFFFGSSSKFAIRVHAKGFRSFGRLGWPMGPGSCT